MALDPGVVPGETTEVGGKTYIWDGQKWSVESTRKVVQSGDVILSNPITIKSNRLNYLPDGYPEAIGLTTQSNANEYFAQATDWLKDNGGGGGDGTILLQSDLPDPDDYAEGTLWVDEDTYDLFVLSGGQWIDLTALPDMSDYVRDADLQFILSEYLRKRDAIDQYYPLERMVHFLQPNGTFKVHLGDGAELDNIITRLIDAERDIIHIQDQIDNLGGDGETPPDTNHPGGQYEYGGGLSGSVPSGFWMASYNVTQWSQIFTFYVSETDLEGDQIEWADHVGEYIQVHRYSGDPHTGADFSSSAVYRISSVNDLGAYDTINVNLMYGTDKGTISVGETFTFEIIDEGTI